MKAAKRLFFIVVGVLAVFALADAAFAFHSGGVAECSGCHSMHSPRSQRGLLVAIDASSTCLTCHQRTGDTGPTSYHVSTAPADMPAGTAPLQLSPGGDFGWLKKDYTYTLRGSVVTEYGRTHGHNIVAADYGYVADVDNATSPGGTFNSSAMSCASCHDPHSKSRRISGNTIVASVTEVNPPIIASGSYNNSPIPGAGQAVGVYRLLGGITFYPRNGVSGAFPGNPPAVAPSTYNQTEATNMVRVAYGDSWSNGNISWGRWCAKCHEDMHSDNAFVHPMDTALRPGPGLELDNYAKYRGSGVAYGTNADAYWTAVPFIEGNGDYEGLLRNHANNNGSYMNGPAAGDEVSCLSCHRAHASGWENGLRWNHEIEMDLVNGLYPGYDSSDPDASQSKWHHGRRQAETRQAYYNWPESRFGTWQRVLCNKCHNKEN